jgi:hypothetical protein
MALVEAAFVHQQPDAIFSIIFDPDTDVFAPATEFWAVLPLHIIFRDDELFAALAAAEPPFSQVATDSFRSTYLTDEQKIAMLGANCEGDSGLSCFGRPFSFFIPAFERGRR